MDCYPTEGGKQDVVFTVHWNCSGVNGAYNGYVYSSQPVTVNSDEPFTPYADLTQDQVLGWIWASGVDKDAVQASVERQIQNQINPPVVTPTLPWVQGA
jgi:hypothetical protein